MENRSIVGLDLVRFGSAIAVMWYHLVFWNWRVPGSTAHQMIGPLVRFPVLQDSAWAAFVSVETFFVISGFVIAMSAENRTATAFLKGRFLRLYPTVWLSAPVSALLILVFATHSPADLLRLLARSMVLSPDGPWVSGVYWTLGVEMSFYALIWLLLVVRGMRWFEGFLVAMSLPSVIFWSHFLVTGVHVIGSSRWYQLLLIYNGIDFALGGLIWTSFRFGLRWWRLALILLYLFIGSVEILPIALSRSAFIADASILSPLLLWWGAVAVIIASIRWNTQITLALAPLLKTIRNLGLATFPLYLIHNELGSAALRVTFAAGLPPIAALLVTFIVLGIASGAILVAERRLRPIVGSWLPIGGTAKAH